MRKINNFVLIILITAFFNSCSTNKDLIEREETKYGVLKFYIANTHEEQEEKKLVAKVNNAAYYSFYKDRILKHTRENKQLIYTLFFDNIPEEMNDPKYYQKLTPTDSIILTKGDKILDSLKWTNFIRPDGAVAFEIEVNYYHGYPKFEKFKEY